MRKCKSVETSSPVHLKVGTRVTVTHGIREGAVTYDKGRIKSRDGEYYMILVEYNGIHSKDYPDGILVERYLCEITPLKG